ncbi:MAG: T9SS C-terminal target domain-containing protein, partial [Flavobacteriaceae bacterium]|nr:T9SS C-terminal target domain-containing protein [Flavobacteriaceae bacterium]
MAVLSATHKAKPNVPEGFNILYVLTQGTDLVIQAVNSDPVFEVTEYAIYTIHTLVYDPNTLDLNIVEFGVTTGVDVYGLIVPGGGSICADLDVAGASFKVTFNEAEECKADAGTIKADAAVVCLDGETTISATPTGDSVVPSGYSTLYVLTKGADLVIVNAGPEPSFTVTEGGNYTIHTLVYDPATLDLTIVELGVTTGVDVFGLIIPGGGDICASLDVPGAPITVEAPDAGTLTADESSVTLENGVATLSATPNGDINVPDGYSVLYVLTQGGDLVIVNAGPDPSFEVTEAGDYTIHTLVYDPTTLDLGIVDLGVTTGVDVFGLIVPGGGAICASLDVTGAPVKVDAEECKADAGTIKADAAVVCLDGET